jgi:hypothetical protein
MTVTLEDTEDYKVLRTFTSSKLNDKCLVFVTGRELCWYLG